MNHELLCAVAVECSPLGKPDNGNLSVNGLSTGSVASINCDKGFDLQGSSSRTCQLNKTWSGSETVCLGKIPKSGTQYYKIYPLLMLYCVELMPIEMFRKTCLTVS